MIHGMDNINETLQGLRIRYQAKALDISDCSSDPFHQFSSWMDESLAAKIDEPNAFILSTVQNDQPRGRVVLLKGLRNGRFVFYTNYQSAKGQEIESNHKASMTFLWHPLQRQVRIEGSFTKVSASESDAYFVKRPRGSQMGAIASPQSQVLKSRLELEELFRVAEEKFKNTDVLPRPAHWGGFELEPTYIEFWQGRDNRLHDRMCYSKEGDSWKLSRLAP